jgi:hypothetical protein
MPCWRGGIAPISLRQYRPSTPVHRRSEGQLASAGASDGAMATNEIHAAIGFSACGCTKISKAPMEQRWAVRRCPLRCQAVKATRAPSCDLEIGPLWGCSDLLNGLETKAPGASSQGAEFKMAIDDPAADDWCDLSWTEWHPFKADFVRASAPVASGIYRIRRAGLAKPLTYIGRPVEPNASGCWLWRTAPMHQVAGPSSAAYRGRSSSARLRYN